jgi:IS30 family transposase
MQYGEAAEKRSLAKVAQKLGKAKSTIDRWSTENEWQERCRDYDNELQRAELEARKKAIKRMQEKHIELADKLAARAEEVMATMTAGDYKPRDVLDLYKLALELERRSRFELLADIELKAGEDPAQVNYSPMMQLVQSLRDARKERAVTNDVTNDVVIYLPENGRDK